MISIYDLPNDVHREIMKLLDSCDICNLYDINKIFWVLPDKQIKYHRLLRKIMPSQCKSGQYIVRSWVCRVLSTNMILELLNRVGFNKDKTFICIKPCINNWVSKVNVNDKSVCLRIDVEYDELISVPNSYLRVKPQSKEYNITIPVTDLTNLIIG